MFFARHCRLLSFEDGKDKKKEYFYAVAVSGESFVPDDFRLLFSMRCLILTFEVEGI